MKDKCEYSEEELFLIFIAFRGLKKIGKDNDQIYIKRLKLELDRIIEKKFTNYFLIVWDYIKWSHTVGIMTGPGRGSSGGSLTALCLEITEIDPIEHDLSFTRFISSIRKDIADFDIDFEDERRDEVFDYLKSKYGENNFSKIITYARFHPKGVLKDVGRIFSIPSFEVNKMCSMIIERSGGDARASFALSDTFLEFEDAKRFKEKYPFESEIALGLEGSIRHKSVHAAAGIVCNKEVGMLVPITKLKGEIVTEFEKQQVEDAKLVKHDLLGLKLFHKVLYHL